MWKSKVDRIKRKQITQDYNSGGLKMIDVHSYIKGLKSSWIKRLLNNQDSKWKSLIQETLNINIDKILNISKLLERK